MAHRGRLNVIANVIGKFCERIFTSFEGSIHPTSPHDQGDVKYHQGANGVRETADGHEVALSVVPNPSHLEFVNPVVEGIVRARQDLGGERLSKLAVLLHGDAAFAGEGIVAETLNLSQFTRVQDRRHDSHHHQQPAWLYYAPKKDARRPTAPTSRSDSSAGLSRNSDNVEAAYNVVQIALDYRQKFQRM